MSQDSFDLSRCAILPQIQTTESFAFEVIVCERHFKNFACRCLKRPQHSTRTHACTHVRMHARTHARTHARMHAHTHEFTRTRTHAHTYTCTHTCTHAHKHALKQAQTHTNTHTHARTYTHTRKTHKLTRGSWRPADNCGYQPTRRTLATC